MESNIVNPNSTLPAPKTETVKRQSNRSRQQLVGRSRLAFVEVGLCILVPCVGFLLWLHFDKDLQASLFSKSEYDMPGSGNTVYDMAVLGENSVVSVQTEGQIRFWDLQQGRCTEELQSHLDVLRCVACSPQKRLLTVGSASGYLETWDLDSPDTPIALSTQGRYGITACQFSPDGKWVCSIGESPEISIWDPCTLDVPGTLNIPGSTSVLRCLSFTSDGKLLIAGDERGDLHLWDFASRRHLQTLTTSKSGHNPLEQFADCMLEAVLMLPGDHTCVAVSRGQGISVWDLQSGTCLRRWAESADFFQSAELSPDGAQIITGSTTGDVSLWEIATGHRLRSWKTHQHLVRAVGMNREGTSIVSGDHLGRVFCHDVSTDNDSPATP